MTEDELINYIIHTDKIKPTALIDDRISIPSRKRIYESLDNKSNIRIESFYHTLIDTHHLESYDIITIIVAADDKDNFFRFISGMTNGDSVLYFYLKGVSYNKNAIVWLNELIDMLKNRQCSR